MMTKQTLPSNLSKRLASDVLNACRNTLHTHEKRHQFYGPVQPVNRLRQHSAQPKALND